MDLKQIQGFAEQGLGAREIAEATGLTLGQVRYRLQKLREINEQIQPTSIEQLAAAADAGSLTRKATQVTVSSATSEQNDHFVPRTKPHYELPERYYRDVLQLMVKDPTTLFAYWEVSDRKRFMISQHFTCDWCNLPKVIRLYDTTYLYFNGTNAHGFIDVEVSDATSYYFKHIKPGTTYVADFGIRNIHGQFIPLMRSNAVEIPRNTVAPYFESAAELEIRAAAEKGYISSSYAAQAANPYEPASIHPYENFSTYTVYEPKDGDNV